MNSNQIIKNKERVINIKIENLEVYGIKASLRAMRNPMDSWERGDTVTDQAGEKDAELSRKLTKAGSEHSKHLRMIQTWVDLTLPRYIWAEFDTYQHISKISCSTMHKLTSRKLTQEDFAYPIPDKDLDFLNFVMSVYKSHKDEKAFLQLKNRLPEGFLQKRTVNVSYQSWLNIYNQRKSHRLPEWKIICDWILDLPDFSNLTGIGYDCEKI